MGALDTQRGIRRNRRPIGCLTGYHFSSRVLPFNIQGHVVHPHRSNRILSMSAVNNYNYNNCEAKNDGTDQKKEGMDTSVIFEAFYDFLKPNRARTNRKG